MESEQTHGHLVISRKPGETLKIGDIEVVVHRVSGERVTSWHRRAFRWCAVS